jgi:hypothetical protein
VNHLVWVTENYVSWSFGIWLSHLQCIATSASMTSLHVVLLLEQPPSHFGSCLLWGQRIRIWITKCSVQSFQDFILRRDMRF